MDDRWDNAFCLLSFTLPAACVVARTGVNNLVSVLLLLAFLALFAVIVFYGARFAFRRTDPVLDFGSYVASNEEELSPGSYDQERFKLFEDCLYALSLGAGLEAPDLTVVELPLPLAYGSTAGAETPKAVVITGKLLEADLTDAEVEAVMADVLAKLFAVPYVDMKYYDIEGSAKDLSLDPEMLTRVREEFFGSPNAPLALLQDTWAARLTGNPKALKTAIIKSRDLMSDTPVRMDQADPLVFVDPPFLRADEKTARNWGHEARELGSTAWDRDRLLQLRLENLDMIAQGKRHPHEFVKGSTPVTKPEGWR